MTDSITLPFSTFTNENAMELLLNKAIIVEKSEGEIITQQFGFGTKFYFMLSGEVNFSLHLEQDKDNYSIGTSKEMWTPIGWSGFRFPNRYATTVQCTSQCAFIEWEHETLKNLFKQYPKLGFNFYNFTLEKSLALIDQVRERLSNYAAIEWENVTNKYEAGRRRGSMEPQHDFTDLLQQSPFFEVFEDHELKKIEAITEVKYYRRKEQIYQQGENSDGFYILNIGQILLQYTQKNKEHAQSLMRSISTRGMIAGWVGATSLDKNDISAIAVQYTSVYFIPKEELKILFNQYPDLGLRFSKRLLWLLSNHLRSARTRLISQQFEKEILAITNLIEQNCTQLSVSSPIHKVPHLLNSNLTVKDAFKCLSKTLKKGNSLERSLANNCLDILGQTNKEFRFFQGLKKVFKSVIEAPPSLLPKEVRNISAKAFVSAFSQIPIKVVGWENLPKKSGNIFIYNHLQNHPYYTLPNHFQLTLDSHFISSVISYQHYGDAGMRVVRVPRTFEYGHQDYYNRLNYINVYTKESETLEETQEQKQARRALFFSEATTYLKQGTNLILSPEGTSNLTQDSPSEFKIGAFQLAAIAEKEPLIVPIVFANFDKRVNKGVYTVIIKPPFLLSSRVKNPKDKEALINFTNSYQQEFKQHVQEAIALSKEI